MTELTSPAVDGGAVDLVLASLPVNPSYEQIRALEHEIAKLPEVETPITHHFADGIYGREMFIPAGTVLTGKIHRDATLNILLSGEIHVTTDAGVEKIVGPRVYVSPPGTKKVGYAHTDVRFMNVHPTKLRDLEAIEAKFIVPEAPLLRQESDR